MPPLSVTPLHQSTVGLKLILLPAVPHGRPSMATASRFTVNVRSRCWSPPLSPWPLPLRPPSIHTTLHRQLLPSICHQPPWPLALPSSSFLRSHRQAAAPLFASAAALLSPPKLLADCQSHHCRPPSFLLSSLQDTGSLLPPLRSSPLTMSTAGLPLLCPTPQGRHLLPAGCPPWEPPQAPLPELPHHSHKPTTRLMHLPQPPTTGDWPWLPPPSSPAPPPLALAAPAAPPQVLHDHHLHGKPKFEPLAIDQAPPSFPHSHLLLHHKLPEHTTTSPLPSSSSMADHLHYSFSTSAPKSLLPCPSLP